MKRTKRERIPSEYREIRVRDWLEGRPTFYPNGQMWIADLGINERNNIR